MTVGASPSSVRTTPSRNDQRLLQSGATITSRRDLPPFKSVLTSLGELAVLVNENLRTRFAAVLLERDGPKRAAIFVAADVDLEQDRAYRNCWQNVVRALAAREIETGPAALRLDPELLSSIVEEAAVGDVNLQADEELHANLKRFESIVAYAVANRASDIHVRVVDRGRSQVLYRIDGDLQEPSEERFAYKNRGHFGRRELELTIAAAFNRYAKGEDASHGRFNARDDMQHALLECEVGGRKIRLRYNSVQRQYGFKAALRLLLDDQRRETFADLGFSAMQERALRDALAVKFGLILVCGPVGAGKSRTIKAMLEALPDLKQQAVYTIEDPVEYDVEGVDPIPVRRETVTRDPRAEDAFAAVRRNIVRMDLDSVSIGEIRDPESGLTARTLVDIGRRVFATLHERTVLGAFARLTGPDVRLDRHAITRPNFINLVVAQRLLPLLCTHCAQPAVDLAQNDPALREKLKAFQEATQLSAQPLRARRLGGCARCNGTGVHGRTAVAEILEPDPRVMRLLREGQDYEAIDHLRSTRSTDFGHQDTTGKTIFEHGIYKVYLGLVDLRDLEREIDTFKRYRAAMVSAASGGSQC